MAAATAWLLLLGVVLAHADAVAAYRILGVFPHIAHSHNVMFKPFFEELAARGHEVVMLSPFPQRRTLANYTDLDLSADIHTAVNAKTFADKADLELGSLRTLEVLAAVGDERFCRRVFSTPHFRDVMAGVHGTFDVVFTEVASSDCWAAVPYKLKVPMISMSTQPGFVWGGARVGYVDNPSYITTCFMDFAVPETFWQRVRNTYMYVAVRVLAKRWMQDASDAVVREFFGADTPPVSELVRNTSLLMQNVWPGVQQARPAAPNVLHVGGLHIVEPKEGATLMDPSLRQWMDDAEHGVVFFTLGSVVRTSTMPREKFLALRDAFAALPQRVLWKFENATMEDQPPNVRLASWFPALEVLSHPKTVLFFTHGGLMGTLEAIYAGVPMLGMPLFSDQLPNVELYRHLGIAERLDHADLTKDNLLSLINKMTSDHKYRERARQVSALYRDRPRTPMEEAVWWTEYVVRHRGAPHLRPVGADLPLHQYLLLDVAALTVAALVAVLVAARALLRAAWALASWRRPSRRAPSSKEKAH